MKQGLFILIIFFVFLFLVTTPQKEEKKEERNISVKEEERGIFISYIELQKYLKGKGKAEGKKIIDQMIQSVLDLNFNLIILQVRSFSDAIYPSTIYPWSATVSTEEGEDMEYDVLAYFLKKSHAEGIALYAWINPYRVRTTENISSISKKNPAFSYIGTDTLWVENGIYYNPSKQEVEDLIVNGVEEIVKKYNVDGILFDDYFYPNNEIDRKDYEEYLKNNPLISLEEYHLKIVNKMIKRVYATCHKYKKQFGISPDGNISNNYNSVFADVKTWVQNKGYVDFIMPQIYYGFYNETQAFKKVIDEWDNMITIKSIKLLIALAFYKVGQVDTYAKSGSLEWIENSDIIMREIILSRNLKHYDGFVLFRYDYLFNKELQTKTTMQELENMKKVLK